MYNIIEVILFTKLQKKYVQKISDAICMVKIIGYTMMFTPLQS